MRITTLACLTTFLTLPPLALTVTAARAENGHDSGGLSYVAGDLELTFSLDAGLGFFTVPNAQNGAGSFSPHGSRASRRDWAEGFVAPGLQLDYNLGDSSLYGGVKVTGALTRGSGDAELQSTTSNRPEALGLEELFIGWKSGIAFAALGEDAIDLSLGRQAFSVGDGFLILEGTGNGGRRAAKVLGPREAFERTAILKLNTQPVRADIFHLESVTDQDFMRGEDAPAAKLYGANIEWFGSNHEDHGRFEYEERAWYVGATVLRLYDSDRDLAPQRDGLNVYAIRTGGAILSQVSDALKDFALYSEYGIQRNSDAGNKHRAHAWYIEPQYTFSGLPWQPMLAYRYAHFSGDADATDTTGKAWDPLFTGGGPRGFGSWDQGEIFAQYIGANSNLNTHMVHLLAKPADDLAIGVVYYRHRFDKSDIASGITSDKLTRELNLYAEWETPLPGLELTFVLGAAKADTGRKQQLAAEIGASDADDTMYLGAVTLNYTF